MFTVILINLCIFINFNLPWVPGSMVHHDKHVVGQINNFKG